MGPVKTILASAATAALIAGFAATAAAGPLENMERERAIMIETMLSGDIDNAQRQGRLEISRTRLVDLERMVLRDQSLVGKNQPLVRAAFANYDLTFVVHASVEKNRSLADHWLSEIGLSTQAIMNARTGRR